MLDPERPIREADIQRSVLPFHDLLQDRIGDRRDQVCRHVDAVELLEMAADLAHAHAARIHRDNLVVEVGESPLILRDQLRIERPRPGRAGSTASSSTCLSEPTSSNGRCGDWRCLQAAHHPGARRARHSVVMSPTSGPNLTFRFAWAFSGGLARASLKNARANQHSIECRRPQRA